MCVSLCLSAERYVQVEMLGILGFCVVVSQYMYAETCIVYMVDPAGKKHSELKASEDAAIFFILF